MAKGFVSGARTTYDDGSDHIIDLESKIKFLYTKKHGVALMKKIGFSGERKSPEFKWNETDIARRRETITLAASGTTTLTVANAYEYAVGETMKVEAEVIRVSAIASSTTLTITRGEAGTTAAAHTAKEMVRMGTAQNENSEAEEGVTDTAALLNNFIQTFDRTVELSTHERAQLSTEGGDPFTGQLRRRMIEVMQQLAMAFMYGVRYDDTSNKRRFTGGMTQFVTTNVTDASAADVSVDLLDDIIQAQVDAGADPNLMVVGTTQKRKLDALDASLQRIGKREARGGNPNIQTWQSGVLDGTIDILVDQTINSDEIWILDTNEVDIVKMRNPGHGFQLLDATANGQDGKKTRILGHYGVKVGLEKSHGYLHNLDTATP